MAGSALSAVAPEVRNGSKSDNRETGRGRGFEKGGIR